jgi:hypothetical protein
MRSSLVFHSALWGALAFTPVAGLAQQSFAAGAPPAAIEGAPVPSNTPGDGLYADGTRAINEGRWIDAEAIFAKVVRQQGEHSDGALYWKAYAQNKQGQVKAALETCAELGRDFSASSWVHECGAMEIEIHARTGEPADPKVWSDDDLKLLALASLMQKDEPRALAQLQEILDGDASEELKKKASFILGQHYSDATYAQIVRISYVEGDVRIARGEQNEKPAGEPWEQAVADLPLETGFSLVTGNGRAEIELEDASTIYLGENSVLTFNDLHTTSGIPYTGVGLLSGTLSLAVKPYIYGEKLVVFTPTDSIAVNYPLRAFVRINSYIDGTRLTSQDSEGLHFPGLAPKQTGKVQTMTLRDNHLLEGAGPDDPTTFAEFDKWVADRVAQRTADMADVMKAAGLTSPIPGLADMKGQGTFFPCAPYGTCWQPGASDDQQQAVSRQPAQIKRVNFSLPSFGTAQLMPMNKPAPLDAGYADAFSPCIPSALRYRVQKDPITGKASLIDTGLGGRASGWGWAVCHAGGFVHRRHHYVWCVGEKRHHLGAFHWVKSEHRVGFVPIHPYDVKGRPPVNGKEEVYAVNNKNGFSLERVKFEPGHPIGVLKSPPREFRATYLRPLPPASVPHMEAHALKESLPVNKGTAVRPASFPLRFDGKSQSFMMSKEVMHGGKTVTVSAPVSNRGGTLQARGGSFAGGHGPSGGSSAHSGASSGGSGGGSHGSSGGGSSGGSHGGGGSSSSSGGSAGGGGGHH